MATFHLPTGLYDADRSEDFPIVSDITEDTLLLPLPVAMAPEAVRADIDLM